MLGEGRARCYSWHLWVVECGVFAGRGVGARMVTRMGGKGFEGLSWNLRLRYCTVYLWCLQ